MVQGSEWNEAEAAAIDGNGDGAIIVPWAAEALQADFKRAGSDLVLEAPDGKKLLIKGYFSNIELKDILTCWWGEATCIRYRPLGWPTCSWIIRSSHRRQFGCCRTYWSDNPCPRDSSYHAVRWCRISR